ncbi:G2/mitotic-specific cyclin-B3-like [Amphiura filiformis]|uniref:G2/mitotic-specific cyclin-B3-like n=1 Tax=Amphiura filiformis TaxID=82378 RepID=UPI003B222D44
MPLTMRNKKKSNIPIQIHQEVGAVKNAPFTRSKRRSDGSPAKNPSKKRAFGDITNAIVSKKDAITKKLPTKIGTKKTTSNVKKPDEVKAAPKPVISVPEPMEEDVVVKQQEMDYDCLEDSLEIILSSQPCTSESEPSSQSSTVSSEVEIMNEKNRQLNDSEIKNAVAAISMDEDESESPVFVDIDEENKEDPNQAPVYARDIFTYLKEREEMCKVTCYFNTQTEVTRHMRAVLVDWMVEVQENFELNHETLYLATKLVDMYLMKCKVSRDILQLLGATGLFIACKYDERCPPALDDFIYICDDAYDRQQFIDMEMSVLREVDFNLGVPLSYRFLRRFAKSCHASMQVLTLARFILEMSLMYSQFMEIQDSLLASATLMLAFKMMKTGKWDATLEHYSGYKECDLHGCMKQLNDMLTAEPNTQLATIRNKYSHKVFYEVATIQPLNSSEL